MGGSTLRTTRESMLQRRSGEADSLGDLDFFFFNKGFSYGKSIFKGKTLISNNTQILSIHLHYLKSSS